MNFLTLSILIAIVVLMLARGFSRPAGVLQFPFLVAATMAGWFIPQAVLLMDDPNLPWFGYDLTMVMGSLSMLAILWADGPPRRRVAAPLPEFDEKRLLIGAAFLSAIGAAAYAMILRTPATQTAEGLTTGIVTIYFFFFTLQYFGLALSLLIFLRRYSLLALAVVSFNYMTIGGFVLFGGRRGPLIEVILITLCALWFQRRIQPPRVLFIVGVLGAALLFNAIGQYRSLVVRINEQAYGSVESRLPTLDEILEIDFVQSFTSDDDRRTDEVRNAIYYIAAAAETLSFSFGLEYWNYFVFRYIPGQLVGHDLKNGLMVSLPDAPVEVYGYQRHIGPTFTGFSDAFASFAIPGALVFGAMALIFRQLWQQAMRGSIKAQYFYCILIATGLHGITHGTNWFFAFLPQAYLFSWMVFRFSSKRRMRVTSIMSRRETSSRRDSGFITTY